MSLESEVFFFSFHSRDDRCKYKIKMVTKTPYLYIYIEYEYQVKRAYKIKHKKSSIKSI